MQRSLPDLRLVHPIVGRGRRGGTSRRWYEGQVGPLSLGHRRVDPYSSQLLQMLILLIVPNDVNCSVSAREAVLDERQKYAILFLRAVEERAEVPNFAKFSLGKENRRSCPAHLMPLH